MGEKPQIWPEGERKFLGYLFVRLDKDGPWTRVRWYKMKWVGRKEKVEISFKKW